MTRDSERRAGGLVCTPFHPDCKLPPPLLRPQPSGKPVYSPTKGNQPENPSATRMSVCSNYEYLDHGGFEKGAGGMFG